MPEEVPEIVTTSGKACLEALQNVIVHLLRAAVIPAQTHYSKGKIPLVVSFRVLFKGLASLQLAELFNSPQHANFAQISCTTSLIPPLPAGMHPPPPPPPREGPTLLPVLELAVCFILAALLLPSLILSVAFTKMTSRCLQLQGTCHCNFQPAQHACTRIAAGVLHHSGMPQHQLHRCMALRTALSAKEALSVPSQKIAYQSKPVLHAF